VAAGEEARSTVVVDVDAASGNAKSEVEASRTVSPMNHFVAQSPQAMARTNSRGWVCHPASHICDARYEIHATIYSTLNRA
jgi:hypothetical protein